MNAPIIDQNSTSNTYRLLKPMDVASLLGISRSFSYQLLQTGAIPCVRIGKALRVRPQDLETYIKQNIHGQVYSQ
jgi:excisionase family DNA binding protein